MGFQPPDRSRAARDHQLPEARWQGMDPDLSGQACHAEASRDPHGIRQGQPGILGRCGEAWPVAVRSFWCEPGARRRGDATRGHENANEVQVPGATDARCTGREGFLMKPAEIRAMSEEATETKLQELYSEWRDMRFQEAVGQMTATSRIREIRKDIARIKTIQGEVQRAAVGTAQRLAE